MHITVRQVAQMLHLPERRVLRLFAEGKLPGHQVGEEVQFSRGEILEWAAVHRDLISAELLAERDAPRAELSEALDRGGVHHDLPADDREALLHAVAERLPIELADRELLFEVLRAREKLGSSAIGDGIALPHPRSPVVLQVEEPVVALCYPERPVDFAAPDGKPVHALFVVLAPNVPAHLHMLGRIALCLQDRELTEMLGRSAGADEILVAVQRIEGTVATANGGKPE